MWRNKYTTPMDYYRSCRRALTVFLVPISLPRFVIDGRGSTMWLARWEYIFSSSPRPRSSPFLTKRDSTKCCFGIAYLTTTHHRAKVPNVKPPEQSIKKCVPSLPSRCLALCSSRYYLKSCRAQSLYQVRISQGS